MRDIYVYKLVGVKHHIPGKVINLFIAHQQGV